jgi:two-component system NtrC family sensor kinase
MIPKDGDEEEKIKEQKRKIDFMNLRIREGISSQKRVKELEGELKTLSEERQHLERLSFLGKLTSDLAHELKNPLFIIEGSSEALRDVLGKISREEEPKIENYLQNIDHNCARIKNLVQKFLSFSKKEENKKASFSINKLKKREVEIELSLTKLNPNVFLDEENFGRILLNLIQNSINAIKEGPHSDSGKIIIYTMVLHKNVKIVIGDNGKGIPNDYLKKIFEPFFSTRHQKGGTGLGLSITKALIEESKGQIKIKSLVNQGTLTELIFPIDFGEEKL